MQLIFDIIWQLCTSPIICLNDAKAGVTKLFMYLWALQQWLELPMEPIEVMFGTWHFIRIVYSDSDIHFMGMASNTPIQSVSQGNGADPQNWAVVSSHILCGLKFWIWNALIVTNCTTSYQCLGFVDNVNLVATLLLQMAQHMPCSSRDYWEKISIHSLELYAWMKKQMDLPQL